jgi:hypothetical protein
MRITTNDASQMLFDQTNKDPSPVDMRIRDLLVVNSITAGKKANSAKSVGCIQGNTRVVEKIINNFPCDVFLALTVCGTIIAIKRITVASMTNIQRARGIVWKTE